MSPADGTRVASPVVDPERDWRERCYRGNVPQLTVRAVIVGMLIGAVMCLSNLYVFLKTGWSMGVTITAAIRSEEAHLTDKFGAHYPAYRDGTAAPGARRFSLERAIRNKEYRAFLGFVAVLALLAARAYF